jgi:hypothetical protein
MPLLMIKCPHTARPVSTGIEIEPSQIVLLPDVAMSASCASCGMVHTWWKREAWLADYVGRPVTEAPAMLRTPRRAVRL